MQDILFGKKATGPNKNKEGPSKQDINQILGKMLSNLKINSIGISPMQQLELKYKQDDLDDVNQLRTILSKKLKYPSAIVAESHHNANRLGNFDIHKEKQNLVIQQDTRFCPCCGFVEQKDVLSVNQDLKDVDHIGVSTYIYFLTIKHILIMLVLLLTIFSIYALITNKTASNMYKKSVDISNVSKQIMSFDGILAYSLGSKQIFKNDYGVETFRIQCWLGVAVIFLWGIAFVFFKYREQTAEYEVDYDSKTASDFTLYFQNLPKNMTSSQLQRQLRDYQQQMRPLYKSHLIDDPITVVKIVEATPFYLDESSFEDKQLKSISDQYNEQKEKLIKLIQSRKDSDSFKQNETERTEIYKKFEFLKEKKLIRLKQITEQIIEEKKNEHKDWDTVPAFVTFGSSYNKQFLQKVHDKTWYKLFYSLPCVTNRRKYFHYEDSKNAASILSAPEPQDILWTNLGQSTCQVIKKKLLTFFVTIVLLVISFFIIYALSFFQLAFSSKGTDEQKSMKSTILSTIISLSISIFNIIIKQIQYYLTKYERNETYIEEQTSLGLKATFAMLINSILIPIIVNKTLKYNLYGVDGLAQDVFYLAITNAILAPIMKIIDPGYYMFWLSKWYYSRPYNRLPLNQNELNDLSQLLQFSIGYEYIYLVNSLLFTCFFVSLQPVIVVFFIVGLFLTFYAQKYYLFNRCRRPTPGYTSVNTAMYQLIYFGPAMYTLGSFCWSNFFDLPNMVGTVPNTVAAIISAIIFILPYKKILQCIVSQKPQPKLTFEEDRIFLPSEYDRMNPQTAQKATEEYKDYISKYKQKLKNKSKEYVEDVIWQLNRQNGTGHRSHRHIMPRGPGFFNPPGFNRMGEDQILIQQLLGGVNQNSINPLVIGNAILPTDTNNGNRKSIQINTVAQNWLTEQQLINNRNSGMNNLNPIADILNKPNNQEEIVTYGESNPQQNNEKHGYGDINLDFGNLIQQDINREFHHGGQGQGQGRGKKMKDSQIPMNLPLNLFGNMLNVNAGPKKGSWEAWDQ